VGCMLERRLSKFARLMKAANARVRLPRRGPR